MMQQTMRKRIYKKLKNIISCTCAGLAWDISVVDIGYTTEDLDGTDTAVVVGTCESDASRCLSRYVEIQEGYTVIGCSRTMFANRVSFNFNFKGFYFSMSIDIDLSI